MSDASNQPVLPPSFTPARVTPGQDSSPQPRVRRQSSQLPPQRRSVTGMPAQAITPARGISPAPVGTPAQIHTPAQVHTPAQGTRSVPPDAGSSPAARRGMVAGGRSSSGSALPQATAQQPEPAHTGHSGASHSGAGQAGAGHAPVEHPQHHRPTQNPSRPGQSLSRPGQDPSTRPKPLGLPTADEQPSGDHPLDHPLDSQPSPGLPTPAPSRRPKRRRKGRIVALVLALLFVLVLAWPIGLLMWANGQLTHVDALSGAPSTPGTTWLLAGNDARGSGGIQDETSGARTDTIMVLHRPDSGPAALISIPRDSLVTIPDVGVNRINAAYAFGGPPLLVRTVEALTGLTIDHYLEIGFGGITDVVGAMGSINLCWDYDVNDAMSGMVWTAGCHDVDGNMALAFTRMRYSDIRGDIGRAERQRQVISAVTSQAIGPGLLVNPGRQVDLLRAGVGSLVVDNGTNITDFIGLATAFRAATGPGGITGIVPIANPAHHAPGIGSTILLDEAQLPHFWLSIQDGLLEPGTVTGS